MNSLSFCAISLITLMQKSNYTFALATSEVFLGLFLSSLQLNEPHPLSDTVCVQSYCSNYVPQISPWKRSSLPEMSLGKTKVLEVAWKPLDIKNQCCYAKPCMLFKFVLLEMQTRLISLQGRAIHLLTILHEIHF